METSVKKYEGTTLVSSVTVRTVYTVHYFRYAQRFAFEGESHDFWEFVYIDSGEARIVAGDKDLTLGQGEAFLHRPNEYHTIKTDNKFARSVIFSFDCSSPALEKLGGVRLTISDEEKTLLFNIVKEGRACFTDDPGDVGLKKMHRSSARPFGGEQLIRLYIEQLLISIYRRMTSPDSKVRPNARNAGELTDRIKEILEDSIYGTISLDEVAGAVFFSKTYIKQVFKRNTGMTIIQYFTQLKIEEAKRLISLNKYSFTEIAYKLGYSSLHYFSRLFAKVTTTTLTEYARSIKADNVL